MLRVFKPETRNSISQIAICLTLAAFVWVPGKGWVANDTGYRDGQHRYDLYQPWVGGFTPHPHPGINQIECPPPARPHCLPGRF